MNKKELINAIGAELPEIKKKDITAVVDSVFDTIGNTIIDGQEVAIPQFGKFTVSERAGRNGINPKTLEAITIAPCKSVKFKASITLKKAVNA